MENNWADLTKREEQIVVLVASALSNAEIGAELGLKEHSVKHRLLLIFNKIGCDNRTRLAILYLTREEVLNGEVQQLRKTVTDLQRELIRANRKIEQLQIQRMKGRA